MSFRRVRSLIKNQHNEQAKTFIEDNDLFNAVDKTRNTLLHYAVSYGNHEIVKYLTDSCCTVDVQNNVGQTPLLRSLQSDLPCKMVVETLIKAGADMHSEKDTDGRSALEIVNDKEWLNRDTKRYEILKVMLELVYDLMDFDFLYMTGNKEDIKRLLQTNIDLSTTDGNGITLYHALVLNINPGVLDLLRVANIDVNIRNYRSDSDDPYTPLMFAAHLGFVNAVEFLLTEGADVEAQSMNGETSLFLAVNNNYDESDGINRSIQLLLEHGANAQIICDNGTSFMDLVLSFGNFFALGELVLAHLAMQEALGTIITELTRSEINSDYKFKTYFEYCQQQLTIEICPSVTLFDLVTAIDRKLERYLRNRELAPILIDFQTNIEYFNTILSKRLPKARRMIGLRETGGPIVGKLMMLGYNNYPFIADQVVSYLKEQDIEKLILIGNDIN